MGLNLTVMSYAGFVDFAFFVDSKLVPDVWDLARATSRAFDELRETIRSHAPTQRSRYDASRKMCTSCALQSSGRWP